MAKAAAMLPQIALCAKKKAWHSGDVPRRKLNRENDVRGTCVFLSLKILFSKKCGAWPPWPHIWPLCYWGRSDWKLVISIRTSLFPRSSHRPVFHRLHVVYMRKRSDQKLDGRHMVESYGRQYSAMGNKFTKMDFV